MGLDDALIFTRVVECHSFTLAAQSLGMQKSTVSRRLALLEERLGVRLLNRTTRKLRLTEVGQAYYERCRQIMLDFAEAEQVVMQLQQEPSGLLRIVAPIEFGQLYLGRLLGEFMGEYPSINAEVELTSRTVDLVEEGIDLLIHVGRPQDSSLIGRPLFIAPHRLYATPEYLARYGTPTDEEDLEGHSGILLQSHRPRFWPLLDRNVPCRRALSCNNITLGREAALAGCGIAVLPRMICHEQVLRGELVELLPEARLPVAELYVVYPSRRYQATKVKAFLEFLMARLPQIGEGLLEPAGPGLITSPV